MTEELHLARGSEPWPAPEYTIGLEFDLQSAVDDSKRPIRVIGVSDDRLTLYVEDASDAHS